MKILHIISSGGMYGAEAVILGLLQRVKESPLDHAALGVFNHAGTAEPEVYRRAREHGLSAHLIACNGQLDAHVPGRLTALVRDGEVDVVHAHGYKADIYAAAAFAGRRHRPVLVSTCHTWYDNDLAVRIYGALDRLVLRGFDEVVAVSREVETRLLQAGVIPERTHLIQNGIDMRPFLREWGRTDHGERLRIGLAGRLAPEKGVDVFLQAAALVARRFPEAEFLVAGDGPEKANLLARPEVAQSSERVRFLGRPASMPAFYASLDVFVSASRQEGLPIVLLEAMASGLPVVATCVGEVPRVVKPQKTGLLVPPEDPRALAQAIERLLADAELRQKFGAAGRARIAADFSLDRMAGDYQKIYDRALRRREAGRRAEGARTL